MKKIFIILTMFISSLTAVAYDFMANGLCYNVNSDGTTVTVTYQNNSSSSQSYLNLSGSVTIPSFITYFGRSYTVTSIDNNTFYKCTDLTSVTIPNSVTSIGEMAFFDCTGLTEVTIPNSVTSIGGDAFHGCTGLTSVTIPNSVTTIGDWTFFGCSGLTSVTIPNSVTSIGNYAFRDCKGLTSVTIPNSVTTIGSWAFEDCTGLTSVTIPNSVTEIGNYTFKGCSGLTSVTWNAKSCAIEYWSTNPNNNPFYDIRANIMTFTFGEGVEKIPAYLCYEMSKLTSVTIPNSVTEIGKWAFQGCSGSTEVIIPNSVTKIGNGTFAGCSGLTSMVVESGNTTYDSRNNCNAIIETATNTLISGCKNTIIPNSVISIGNDAFYECTSLTSVTIPNSVTSIGSYAFWGCSGLISMTIPNSVTEIGNAAFANCTGLTSVTIPNSMITIGSYAFWGCSGLTSLTLTGKGSWYPKNNMPTISQIKTVNIGSGITSLGNFGFTPDMVNCYVATPPSCSSGTFSNYDGALHVPQASMASYFMAYLWQNFNNMHNDLTEKVTIYKTSANLVKWETLSLAAVSVPEGSNILWASNNPAVATVDENGVVTATGEGECDIFATLASNPAVYTSCHILVSYPEITLTLSDESLEMNLSEEQILTVTITPDNTGLTPTWSSSNTSVAAVDEKGKVVAVGEGECDIIAKVLDQTATCHVTVTNNVIITLNLDNAIIGANQALTVYPSCSPDVPVELVVTTSDPSVAVARVINRSNAPAAWLMQFDEEGKALAMMEEMAAASGSKAPALASEKAIMIVGVQNGTATITVTTADGKATPAVLELRVVDVNGDGFVTSADVTAVYDVMLGIDNQFESTADVNGDGFVTSADVTAIYDILLGN